MRETQKQRKSEYDYEKNRARPQSLENNPDFMIKLPRSPEITKIKAILHSRMVALVKRAQRIKLKRKSDRVG